MSLVLNELSKVDTNLSLVKMSQKSKFDMWATPTFLIDNNKPFSNEKKINVITNEVKVDYVFLQILGVFPLQRNEIGIYKLRKTSLLFFYTFLLNILTYTGTAITFTRRQRSITALIAAEASNDEIFMVYYAYLFFFYQIIPFSIFLDMSKIEKYLERWQNFQITFAATTRKSAHVNLRVCQIGIVIMLTLGIIVFNIYYRTFVMKLRLKYSISLIDDEWEFLLISYYGYLFFTPCVFWLFHGITFGIVASRLLNSVKGCNGSAQTLKQYRMLWRELRDITCDLGSACSWSGIFFVTEGFGLNMLLWYTLLVVDTGIPWYTTCTLATCSSTFMAVFPDICHRASEKLGSDFQNELGKQARIFKSNDYEQELKKFDDDIHNHPPNISLAGYGNMNRHFSIAVLSNFMTYMVVVLQFHKAKD